MEDKQLIEHLLKGIYEEIECAHVTGNMNLRGELINDSIKVIDAALADRTE
ncbi:hypothetical protein [Oceanobacillus sp. FSL H7-0719]|uniref:hypothetical protein n=1 Tax=Oceanobacillus sp. FSL H7-0719 TaxID=2954507 RepID=UPI003249F4C2